MHGFLAAATVCACSTTASVGGDLDGSVEAGVTFDANFDGSSAADAGTARCVGAPPPCETLLVPDHCVAVDGCGSRRCRGAALACADRSVEECRFGCVWDGACTGDPDPCLSLTDDDCPDQPGCALSPDFACGGTGVACESLAPERCGDQPGCALDACAPGEGTTTLELRVVSGRRVRAPLEGAHLRAEAPCTGAFVETVTAADGTARLELDRSMGPWDLTIAKALYNAISILEASEVTIGDVYLEGDAAIGSSRTITGVLTGTIGEGHRVLVSASSGEPRSFDGLGPFDVGFVWVPELAGSTIDIVALELDELDRAVNIAVATRALSDVDVDGVELDFPVPAVVFEEVRYRIEAQRVAIDRAMPSRVLHDAPGYFGRNGVLSGTAFEVADGLGIEVTVRTFPTAIASDYVLHTFETLRAPVEVAQHDLSDPSPTRLAPDLRPLLSIGAVQEDVVTYPRSPDEPSDLVAVEINELGALEPVWRVFAPTDPARVYFPALPTAVPREALRWHELDGGIGDDVRVYDVRMRPGVAPWSTPHTVTDTSPSQRNKRPEWIHTRDLGAVEF